MSQGGLGGGEHRLRSAGPHLEVDGRAVARRDQVVRGGRPPGAADRGGRLAVGRARQDRPEDRVEGHAGLPAIAAGGQGVRGERDPRLVHAALGEEPGLHHGDERRAVVRRADQEHARLTGARLPVPVLRVQEAAVDRGARRGAQGRALSRPSPRRSRVQPEHDLGAQVQRQDVLGVDARRPRRCLRSRAAAARRTDRSARRRARSVRARPPRATRCRSGRPPRRARSTGARARAPRRRRRARVRAVHPRRGRPAIPWAAA